jgi:hypothetical protein
MASFKALILRATLNRPRRDSQNSFSPEVYAPGRGRHRALARYSAASRMAL